MWHKFLSDVNLSIIVPTYNETGNVSLLVQRLHAALGDIAWEVLFVDDNSSDGTADEIYALSQADPRVRLILRVADRGLAKSSIQGMLSAKGRNLLVMDADGQHDPTVIMDMLERLESEGLDIISAARKLDQTGEDGTLSATRQTLSRTANSMSCRVIGKDLIDPMTGFFLIRRDRFLPIAVRLQDAGFKLLLDILHSDKSLKHEEILFRFGQRVHGESKLDALVMWQFATFLMSRATGKILPPSLISFIFVGGSGVFVHFLTLYSLLGLGLSFAVAQIGATTIAASSNFVLNNILTFRDKRLIGRAMVIGYFKFLAAASVGILANVSAAVLTYGTLTDFIFVATLAGIAIDTIWKFAVSRRLIWK